MTLYNGTCTDKCPDRYYSEKGTCEKCKAECDTCEKKDECKTCPDKHYLSKKKECKDCKPECKACKGKD